MKCRTGINVLCEDDLKSALFYLSNLTKEMKENNNIPQSFYQKEKSKLRNMTSEVHITNIILRGDPIDNFFSESNQNVDTKKIIDNANYNAKIVTCNKEKFFENICTGNLLSNKMLVWTNWIDVLARNCIMQTPYDKMVYLHWLSCSTMTHFSNPISHVIFNNVIGMLLKSYSFINERMNSGYQHVHHGPEDRNVQEVRFIYKTKTDNNQQRGLYVKTYYSSLLLMQDVACGIAKKDELESTYNKYIKENRNGITFSRGISLFRTLNCTEGSIRTERIDEESCLVTFKLLL